jgi:hydroxyacylglutathione hydrolase
LILEGMAVGPIQANCYILGCEKSGEAVVIDPGDEPRRILKALERRNLTLKYILNTHGHFDHVGADQALREATSAPVLIHQGDAPLLTHLSASAAVWGMRAQDCRPDGFLEDGDIITFGQVALEVIHTPGHSPGGVSFYTPRMVFVGDTLFAGSIGRTDFPGGNYDRLIRSVQERLFVLGDDVEVYPGHGPATTIGAERRYNPFFN